MNITYFGHSCLQVEFQGGSVLFDPFISGNPLAKSIDIMKIKADYIFLSHAHGDHVGDLNVIQKTTQAKVVAIVETADWAAGEGIPKENLIGINFGGTIRTSFGKAKMVYALHTNATPDGLYGGQPAGYVLEGDGKRIYFAGDTALTVEMELLADLNIDISFLPIGDFYTMGVDDAIKAAKLIKCNNIVGIHYDTFPPIEIDKKEAVRKFSAAGLDLKLPAIGERFEY